MLKDMDRVKRRVYEILERAAPDDRTSKAVDIGIMILILLNVAAVTLETVQGLYRRYSSFFWAFEALSVGVFTLEYILRLWSCTTEVRFSRPVAGRLRFATTPLAVVDLLAVLPFYLPMLLPLDLRFIRAIRLFRLFRLFKLGRYSESLRLLGVVLRARKEELIMTVFTISVLLIISSSLMYFVENEAQPQAFSSIPEAMWWGIVTLTTVGYGDVYPVTPLGKVLGAVIALLGIGMFALPAGILGSGFIEEVQRRKGRRTCPHCGREIYG